jgi:predicted RNA-binding Zn ribbon-like protein
VSDRSPAGPELLLVQRFINTLDVEAVADEIGTPAQLAAWLSAEDLGAVEAGAEGHARALALREALRGLALANNGGERYPLDLGTLNRVAAEARLRPRFGRAGVRLEPEAEGLDAALGRLLATVYQAVSDGTWERVKACAMHDCRFVFYDESKNRTRTWCSMRVCGNRVKVRRFRAKSARGPSQ